MKPLDYIQQTLALAEQTLRSPSPNPYVACLIVREGKIVGTGIHQGAGSAHAEVLALQQAGSLAEGADVYVNLEPCCHFGRTPPCVNALITAKVKRVFCAMVDPNPLVAGKGVQALRAAGIEVHVGFAETQARWLNRFFIHYIQQHTPYVIAKWAMSLDGQMQTHAEDDRIITNVESHRHAHHTRKEVDAIMIGVNTALADNPALTVRYADNPTNYQPLRIILDSTGRLPVTTPPSKTLIVTTEGAAANWIKSMQAEHEIWVMTGVSIMLPEVLAKLGQRHVASLLVEGGRTLLTAFITQGLVQETHTYLGANLIAGLTHKKSIAIVEQQVLQDNFFCRGVL